MMNYINRKRRVLLFSIGFLVFFYGCLGSEFSDRARTETEKSSDLANKQDGANAESDPESPNNIVQPYSSGDSTGEGSSGAATPDNTSGSGNSGSTSSARTECSKSGTGDLYMASGSFRKLDSSTGKIVGASISLKSKPAKTLLDNGRKDNNFAALDAMSVHQGVLYGAHGHRLYRVNSSSGVLKRIGKNAYAQSFWAAGGLASQDGKLYLAGGYTKHSSGLFIMNTSTGVGERVGKKGDAFGLGITDPLGLASLAGTLYMVDKKALYTVNATTGKASRVGNTENFGIKGMIIGWPGGLTVLNGKLYMILNIHGGPIIVGGLYQMNTSTGKATRVNKDDISSQNWGCLGSFKKYDALASP